MWLSVAFYLLAMIAGCVFLGLCVCEAVWRNGGTPPILLWVGGTYGVALVFMALGLLTLVQA